VLSAEVKANIDALSPEEITYELNLGAKSRFQGEKFAYLQTRSAHLAEQKTDNEKAADNAQRLREYRLTSISTIVAIICSVTSLVLGGGWYQEHEKSRRAEIEANQRLVADYLQPIATLLSDNKVIFEELRSPPYVEPGWGILESYLIKIRRDGVAVHALMKKRIDTLVSNNEAIITLLSKYAAYAKTRDFQAEATKYRDHAIRYNDRWKSLLEIYAADGDFPTAALVFPDGFPAAVQAEIDVRQDGI